MLLKILYCLCIVLQIIFVPLFLKAQWPGICRKSLFFKRSCSISSHLVFSCLFLFSLNLNLSVWIISILSPLIILIILPFISILLVLVCNNKRMLGENTNTLFQNILGVGASIITLILGTWGLYNVFISFF